MLAIYPPSAYDVYRKVKINYSPAIDAACDEIYKACVGLGTDEAMLVKILGPKSANDRAIIGYRYKELYGKSLFELIKSETSGEFGFLLQMLCMSLPHAEAFIVHRACKGMGTSENLLYPVLLGRTNDDMEILKKAFFEMYEKDMAVVLDSELSGDFKQVIMTSLQGARLDYKPSFHTEAKAMEDAEMIYKAGEGKWGTDEGKFVKTLLSCPPQHLRNVDRAYTQKYGHDLVKACEAEFSGDAKNALVYFVDPFAMLADHLEGTMAGVGTDENALSATLVRYHPYLSRVMPFYQNKYKTGLRERIHGETSGKFRDLLLHVIDAPVSIGAFA